MKSEVFPLENKAEQLLNDITLMTSFNHHFFLAALKNKIRKKMCQPCSTFISKGNHLFISDFLKLYALKHTNEYLFGRISVRGKVKPDTI